MLRPGKHGVMPWKAFLFGVKAEYRTDRVGDMAGMVTFAAFLALFPFLLFLVSLAALVIDPTQAQSLIEELRRVAPPQVAQILGDQIQSLSQNKNGGLLTVGALGAIWAASSGMIALTKALNTAYDVEERRKFVKLRGLAIGMVFVIAVLLIIAVAVAVLTPVIADRFGGAIAWVVRGARFPVSGMIMLLVVGLLYWVLPDLRPRPFKFITFGSICAVALWLVASWGFSVYVQNFSSYEASYGALGGVIIFLLWMYLSANVMLLGAEMNAVLEEHARATGQVKARDETAPTLTSSGQEVPPKHVAESGEGKPPGVTERGESRRSRKHGSKKARIAALVRGHGEERGTAQGNESGRSTGLHSGEFERAAGDRGLQGGTFGSGVGSGGGRAEAGPASRRLGGEGRRESESGGAAGSGFAGEQASGLGDARTYRNGRPSLKSTIGQWALFSIAARTLGRASRGR